MTIRFHSREKEKGKTDEELITDHQGMTFQVLGSFARPDRKGGDG